MFLDLDQAIDKTRELFVPIERHYDGYPQYRSFEVFDEHGCISCIISCPQGSEPLGRRWKTIVATELRAEHHIETLARKNSFRRNPENEDDDPKKDRNNSSKRFRSKFKSGFHYFAKHMCMGANGHRAEEGSDLQGEHADLHRKQSIIDHKMRVFLSSLLDTQGWSQDNRSYGHLLSPANIHGLVKQQGSYQLLLGALLNYYAANNTLRTKELPSVRLESSEKAGTCSLGLMITTNGPNPSTTFTEIHAENFFTEEIHSRSPHAFRRRSLPLLQKPWRIAKQSPARYAGKTSSGSSTRRNSKRTSCSYNRRSTSPNCASAVTSGRITSSRAQTTLSKSVSVNDSIMERNQVMSRRAKRIALKILRRKEKRGEEESRRLQQAMDNMTVQPPFEPKLLQHDQVPNNISPHTGCEDEAEPTNQSMNINVRRHYSDQESAGEAVAEQDGGIFV